MERRKEKDGKKEGKGWKEGRKRMERRKEKDGKKEGKGLKEGRKRMERRKEKDGKKEGKGWKEGRKRMERRKEKDGKKEGRQDKEGRKKKEAYFSINEASDNRHWTSIAGEVAPKQRKKTFDRIPWKAPLRRTVSKNSSPQFSLNDAAYLCAIPANSPRPRNPTRRDLVRSHLRLSPAIIGNLR
ncbi:hypothetical protein ACOMHN_006558 [Nucella lapillus]